MTKKLDKNIIVLGWVSFFTDISSEMLYPLIPIFLNSVLGASMAIVGLIEGVAEATASIVKVFSGLWSDTLRARKPFIFTGYGLSSIAKPLLALSFFWPQALFARFIDRFGKGLRTSARDALIADSSEVSTRGFAFGLHRAMDTLGAVIGPLLAVLLIHFLKEDFRRVFLVAFIPALLGVFLIFNVKERMPLGRNSLTKTKLVDLSCLTPPLRRFILIWGLFCLGNSSDVFLIMRTKDIGFSTTMVIFAYTVYNISYSLFSAPFGRLSDRWGRKKVLILGLCIFTLVYFGFAKAGSAVLIWPLFAVYGLFMALTEGTSKAFVADLAREEVRATSLGVFYTVTGILSLLASTIAGILWTRIGPHATFLYGSVMALLSLVLFGLLF